MGGRGAFSSDGGATAAQWLDLGGRSRNKTPI